MATYEGEHLGGKKFELYKYYEFYVDIELFCDAIEAVRKVYPKEVKKFLQNEGTKLKNRTVKKAESSVNKETGDYLSGIKRGKYYMYEGKVDTVRVYAARPAYHAHLIEYGHDVMVRKKGKEGKTIVGRAKAYNVYHEAGEEFQSRFEIDCEKFADKIMKKLD